MKVSIQIPAGVVAEDSEAVAFRCVQVGEEYIDEYGHRILAEHNVLAPRLVVRKKWVWPPWLRASELRWSSNHWVAKVLDATGRATVWAIMWSAINYPEPPDRSRVYHNPENENRDD